VSTLEQYYPDYYKNPYGDVTDYPDTLVVGDALFPLLYIYIMGDQSLKKKVGNQDKYETDLKAFFDARAAIKTEAISAESNSKTNLEIFKTNLVKYNKMMLSALKKNRNFSWELNNVVVNVMVKYKSRLPQVQGNYYYGKDGGTSYFPFLDMSNPDNYVNIFECLRLLYENNLIAYDYELGVRPISLYDGSFADLQNQTIELGNKARKMGLPSRGAFMLNNRQRSDWMYRTFTGTDIVATVSLGDTVTRLEGMTSLSWSVHRGKQTQRVLGQASPAGRSGGSRTVAGTMVFTLSDHNPLMDLLPDSLPWFKGNASPIGAQTWQTTYMADQLPPFDMVLILYNEYGSAACMVLYGIEIQDEGGVISVNNMVIEATFSYTAVAMENLAICEVDPQTGKIDPYGIFSGGYSNFWRRRELMISGHAYSDLQEAFNAQYDSMIAQANQYVQVIIANKQRSSILWNKRQWDKVNKIS
jgi:hypothetical protein